MKRKIIFIGGIHGAGKGTISKNICSNTSIIPLTASDLIKWAEINIDHNNKKVNDILNTQERLIKGINSIVNTEDVYLLDGHFCLLNKNSEPEKVPLETFQEISPIIIAVVKEDVNLILDRLDSRDRKMYDFDTLNKMQEIELNYAQEISDKLDIPLVVIKKGDSNELIQLIKKSTNENIT